MNPLLIELQYLPPISCYRSLWECKNVFFEKQEHYQKGSYRNRCHIASAQGVLRLSIPLQKGKNEQLPITKVRMATESPWRKLHWNAIRTCYGSAPFFEHYAPHFEKIYLQQEEEYLFDWNLALFRLTLQLLKISDQTPVHFTETYQKPLENEVFTDRRNKINPKTSASKTSDENSALKYPQLFEETTGFLPDLSIIDALFCCGPRAIDLIR